MSLRKKLTKSEIAESEMLRMDEVLEVLRELGFVNISVNMIRKYLTLGLLERPRMGPPGFLRARAKYESYFSKQQLLAIVDIRLRMGRGYKIEEILQQQMKIAKDLGYWARYRRELETLVIEAEPYFKECLAKLRPDNKEGEKSVQKILKIIAMKQRKERRIDQEALGANIDPNITKTIEVILDRKFGNNVLTI